MLAGGEVAFEAMKMDQLKAELVERGSTRPGRKAILQRRLHAYPAAVCSRLQDPCAVV